MLVRAEAEDPEACLKIVSNSLCSGCLIRDSILLLSEAERIQGLDEAEGGGVEDSPGRVKNSTIDVCRLESTIWASDRI